jgi:EAL domain-containing protein (putative c-di-GMP-specific phosphodiesterase class I)
MTASGERTALLLVDDDEQLLDGWHRYFRQRELDVSVATTVGEALKILASKTFDAIVSDIGLPDADGIELLRRIREIDADVPVILATGTPDVRTAILAVDYGAYRYLTKPVPLSVVSAEVERAAHLCRLARAKRAALALTGTGEPAGDRAGLEAGFGRALDKLWMAFQPIVRAADGSLFAYEALVRSDEPTLPHPGALLDASERLDRMRDLARTIRTAAAAAWRDAPKNTLLFVNLRSQDLYDEALFSIDDPLRPLASNVVLEVTERESLESVADARARIARLREAGFRVAIDDLGAGYAGLTSFALLEPEFVKIDMSLVRNVEIDATKRKLVASMVGLCHEMGMPVVAEGVETEAERQVLVELGCDLLQGYLFGRPGRPFPIPR